MVDFDEPQVLSLLRVHLEGMQQSSPPGTSYALDLSGLQVPTVTFVAAWCGTELAGFGAIKELASDHGEVKSMRTAPAFLRCGVASRILDHLLELAAGRGYRLVSLETGSGAAFEPALAMYRRYGFVEGDVFGDYTPSAFNRFFHLALRSR